MKDRPCYFTAVIRRTHGETFNLQDLTVEDGRGFIRELMERDMKYSSHPLLESRGGKLAIQYIHGCGRSVRSFCSWAYEEGFLEEDICRVLAVCLDHTLERLRNYSLWMLFLDTGLRLNELITLKRSRIDFGDGGVQGGIH